METCTGGSDIPPQTGTQRGGSRNTGSKCGGCCSRIVSLLCSNLGVCLLVLLYTAAGAFLFTTIEGDHLLFPVDELTMSRDFHEIQQDQSRNHEATTSSPDDKIRPAAVTSHHKEPQRLRQETVDRLWTITESLNILYKDNWTRVAERELLQFSEDLLNSFKEGQEESVAVVKDKSTHPRNQWTFAGSFLYSLTVITTIGKFFFIYFSHYQLAYTFLIFIMILIIK